MNFCAGIIILILLEKRRSWSRGQEVNVHLSDSEVSVCSILSSILGKTTQQSVLFGPAAHFPDFQRLIPHLQTAMPFYPSSLPPSLWFADCSRPQTWPPLIKTLIVFEEPKHGKRTPVLPRSRSIPLFKTISPHTAASSALQHSFLTWSLCQGLLYSESPTTPQLPLIWGWGRFPK